MPVRCCVDDLIHERFTVANGSVKESPRQILGSED